jgi:hypothetical protein
MKLQERTGQWVEIERTRDRTGEITIHVPTSIWAGWTNPYYLKEDELASFLRSIGWEIVLPSEKPRR